MLPEWFVAATAAGEAGASARAADWASTEIGPPDTWPMPLQAAVELCFSTRFPVLVAWGPRLEMIYNDGYMQMLGTDKHPSAMGSPTDVVWEEAWDDLSPVFAQVMRRGSATWSEDARLVINRSGFEEETTFTFSISPLRGEDGTVQGVLDIATETTDQVVDRRRLVTLSTLSAAMQDLQAGPARLARVAVDVLARSEDVDRSDVYLFSEGGDLVSVTAMNPLMTSIPVPMEMLRRVVATRTAETLGSVLMGPILGAHEEDAAGVLVLGANPLRPFDAANRQFLDLVVSTVSTTLSSAFLHVRQVDEHRKVSDALQEAMLPPHVPLPGLRVRYRPADVSLAVGGDWYDVVELPGRRRGLLVGDCVGHGLGAAARMGQLRSAGRALLLENARPGATLEALDRFADTLPGAECTTLFCGVIDEEAGTLTYASAGHPPPLVVPAGGGTMWLDAATSPPLAVVREHRVEDVVPIGPGDTVALYTDGLVERRDESLVDGLNRLSTVLHEVLVDTAWDAAVDTLLARMLPDGSRDDVVLMLYRVGA